MAEQVNRRQRFGRWGEEKALAYLLRQGYVLIERNYRTSYGEIDLIMGHEDMLVFVEVKTRSSTRYGQPEAAVSPLKQSHLLQSAEQYLQEHPGENRDWRVDVVSILQYSSECPAEIMVFENAIIG